MNKYSHKQKQYNERHAYINWRRDLKRSKKKHRLALLKLISERTGINYEELSLKNYTLRAPEKFNLNENYDESVEFLNKLREKCRNKNNYFSVDFKTIQEISPAAALALTAEIDRWRRTKNVKLKPVELRKWNPSVRRLLTEMGFFEILGVEHPFIEEDKIENKNLQFIRFITGNQNDGSLAKELRLALENIAGPVVAKQQLYSGITEAMANSVEHAYPDSKTFHSSIKNRWWMSGSFNKENGCMTVMLYDLGVGIPITLPNSGFWDLVTSFLNNLQLTPTDSNLIRGAMEIGKTRTKLKERGRGLYDMRDFIIRSGQGILRIVSCRGDYSFFHSKKYKTKENKQKLDGTLIAWQIYV